MNMTIGEAIDYLIDINALSRRDLATILKINGTALNKIIRGEKELTLLMAARLLERFELSVDEFFSLLSQEEIHRKDLSTIKWMKKQHKYAKTSIK